MGKNDTLQLHQYEVNENNIIEKEIYVYSWPKILIEYITKSDKNYKLNSPIKNLSQAIALTIDDVIYVRNKIVNNKNITDSIPWIFSLSEINIDIAMGVIKDWIVETKINNLTIMDFEIEEPYKISSKDIFMESYKSDIYNIIPYLYRNEFCNHKIKIPSSEIELSFFPVINNADKAEAISNTIKNKEKETDFVRYSYAVTFKLVNNREFWDKFFLNISYGRKEWISRPLIDIQEEKNYIGYDENATSIYIYKENDYIYNERKKLLKLKFHRDTKTYYRFKEISDDIVAKIFDINLKDALNNPNSYNYLSQNEANEVILITNNNKNEQVKRGIGLGERIDIFNEVGNVFPNLVSREPVKNAELDKKALNIKKIKQSRDSIKELRDGSFKNKKFKFINKENHKYFYERPPVFVPYEDKLYIEIYTNNDELIEAFIENCVAILRLSMPLGKYNYMSHDGFEVEFVPKNGYIARALSKEEQQNENLRKEEIKNLLSKDEYKSSQVISFIDIEAFHKLNKEGQKQDPKKIIRSSFKDLERTTQFINGFDSEDAQYHSLINGIYDLFSSASFICRYYFEYKFNKKILLGLSSCDNSKGNLIVLSKIEDGRTTFKIFGIPEKKWLPLKKLLPKIERYKDIYDDKKNMRLKFNQWIADQLNSLPETSKQYILLFDASLRNNYWKFASNSELDINKIGLISPDSFRFIRVNTTEEVPRYNIIKNNKDPKAPNRFQGLFSHDNNVFYSVGSRPYTMQLKADLVRTTSKNMIPIQSLVEFTVLNDDETENIHLANIAHTLRKLNLTFDFSTKYPLPIYINNRFGEYLDL